MRWVPGTDRATPEQYWEVPTNPNNPFGPSLYFKKRPGEIYGPGA